MPYDMSIHAYLTNNYLNNPGIIKSKLILGFPLYGRKFAVNAPYMTSYYSDTVEYRNFPTTCSEQWDAQSMVPYMTCGGYYITYDDIRSMSAKYDYVVKNTF
jgi:GH18 family chitinase